MLTKTSTIILGVIQQQPINAYEVIKMLGQLHVKDWYDIADSTVYATLKTLEKKNYISGEIRKDGNMPDKTVYSITQTGYSELKNTISHFITNFDYDIVPFMIACFFIRILTKDEAINLLSRRIKYLEKYKTGILNQLEMLKSQQLASLIICNIEHNNEIICAEISSSNKLIEVIQQIKEW